MDARQADWDGMQGGFLANSWLLARNSTQLTAQARLIARRKGLVQRFPNLITLPEQPETPMTRMQTLTAAVP
ncbi:hypothetical protein B0B52_13640 [Polaromonas sp. A23]|nr:hypothetical protein B0B52_13640 [Polaromonas sp. A23]